MTCPHRERDAPGGAMSRVTGAVCRLSVRELVHDRHVDHDIDLAALDSASASAAAGALGLGHAGADHLRHGEHLSEVAPGECGPLLGLVARGGHGRLARALELVDVVAQEQGDATQLDVIADRSRGRSDDDRYVGDVMNPDRDLVRGRVAADIAAAVVVLADRSEVVWMSASRTPWALMALTSLVISVLATVRESRALGRLALTPRLMMAVSGAACWVPSPITVTVSLGPPAPATVAAGALAAAAGMKRNAAATSTAAMTAMRTPTAKSGRLRLALMALLL